MTEIVLIGDLVRWRGEKWVVCAKAGAPNGRYARLANIEASEPYLMETYDIGPSLIERPEFSIGQRVKVGMNEGVIVAELPIAEDGQREFRILFDAYRRPIPSGGYVAYIGHHVSVPGWRLTLENTTKRTGETETENGET